MASDLIECSLKIHWEKLRNQKRRVFVLLFFFRQSTIIKIEQMRIEKKILSKINKIIN